MITTTDIHARVRPETDAETKAREDGRNVFEIPRKNWERFEAKMEKVARKCHARGLPFYMKVIDTVTRQMEVGHVNRYGNRRIIRVPCFLVVVEGLAIINGWKLVGRIEHAETGNIIYTVPTFEGMVPEIFRTSDPYCDHCNTKRQRKETFAIVHEDGTHMQVGRACLQDYLGIDAETIASAMQHLRDAPEYRPPMGDMPGPETDTALLFCAETVRKFGFKKKDAGKDATAEVAWTIMHPQIIARKEDREELEDLLMRVHFDPYGPEAVRMVDEAKEWLASAEPDSDYIYNLQAIVAREDVNKRHMGFLASIFAAHEKAKEIAEERRRRWEAVNERIAAEAAASTHVGEVGQRVEFDVAEVRLITTWEGPYGYTGLYKIKDRDGNVFIWKTGNFVPDNVVKVRGTVKAHEDYNGTAQTVLTRCQVTVDETGGN